jgi:putative two-component system response regulator
MTSHAAILIVDDEDQITRSLKKLLTNNGYWCQTAANVGEARAALRERAFDVVLCDMKMPGESGLELLQDIFAAYPETAVIMITGVDEPELAKVALEAGAYGYLVKPFTGNEILINTTSALIRRALESESRAHREELVATVRERTEEIWNTVRYIEKTDERLRASIEEMVARLSLAAEMRDDETAVHIERMSRYSELLARAAGYESEWCAEIRLASRLHDAGKIAVPDRVLRKRGRFTPADRTVMQLHAEAGYRLFSGSEAELLKLGASIAWTHHERWDGSGYPRGLVGKEIPIEGRIAAIADVFDALMSKRPYKPAFPLEQVVNLMRDGSGTHFDPELTPIFLDSLDKVLAITQSLEG